MRKTILTGEFSAYIAAVNYVYLVKHWFPYIKTRIEVIDTEVHEISPIEV